MNLAARLSKFNMSEDDLNLLVEKQTVGGILLCAVCGGTEPDVIDHDHETGKVRGLLHDKCNSGLGAFHDDPELLQVASSYLVNAMNKFAEQTFKELDDL